MARRWEQLLSHCRTPDPAAFAVYLCPRPVRPAAAPGALHEEAGAGVVESHFPYNEFTISRCAAGAHLACGRGTMPRALWGALVCSVHFAVHFVPSLL